MDEVIVGPKPPNLSFDEIMTTWHDADSLTEALDFFLFNTLPYEDSITDCQSGLIIKMGNSDWLIEIERHVSTKVVGPIFNQ